MKVSVAVVTETFAGGHSDPQAQLARAVEAALASLTSNVLFRSFGKGYVKASIQGAEPVVVTIGNSEISPHPAMPGGLFCLCLKSIQAQTAVVTHQDGVAVVSSATGSSVEVAGEITVEQAEYFAWLVLSQLGHTSLDEVLRCSQSDEVAIMAKLCDSAFRLAGNYWGHVIQTLSPPQESDQEASSACC
jgi:hypothetical protein